MPVPRTQAEDRSPPPASRTWALWLVPEGGFLFLVVPAAFWWSRLNQATVSGWLEGLGLPTRLATAVARGQLMIPTLLAFGAGCLVYLLLDRSFEKRRLWNLRAGLGEVPRILLIFVPTAALLSLVIWLLQPGSALVAEAARYGLSLPPLDENAGWLRLPRERPELWIAIMILYPVFSVWPQEVVYRAFFHHRYAPILRTPLTRIIVGGAVFGPLVPSPGWH